MINRIINHHFAHSAVCNVLVFVVFVGRMGNTKQALQLITNELGDVNQAIAFCKEHNEHELWEDLISYSIDKPCGYQLPSAVIDAVWKINMR